MSVECPSLQISFVPSILSVGRLVKRKACYSKLKSHIFLFDKYHFSVQIIQKENQKSRINALLSQADKKLLIFLHLMISVKKCDTPYLRQERLDHENYQLINFIQKNT